MNTELNKTTGERIFQSVLFEAFALILISYILNYLTRVSLGRAGMLSFFSALTATIWNYIYNRFFDYLQQSYGFHRGMGVRLLHAVIFETGLIVFLVPVAMILLHISLVNAIVVEAGLVLFFVPYTIVFNWSYDFVRWKIIS